MNHVSPEAAARRETHRQHGKFGLQPADESGTVVTGPATSQRQLRIAHDDGDHTVWNKDCRSCRAGVHPGLNVDEVMTGQRLDLPEWADLDDGVCLDDLGLGDDHLAFTEADRVEFVAFDTDGAQVDWVDPVLAVRREGDGYLVDNGYDVYRMRQGTRFVVRSLRAAPG